MQSRYPAIQKFFSNNILLANCIFFLFSAIFSFATFSHLKADQFFLIHDQSAPISAQQLFNNSFVRLGDSGGLAFGIQSSVALPNNILYDFLFHLGLSIKNIQFIAFSLCLYLILSLSFFGFYKLNRYYSRSSGDKDDLWNVLIVTFFYCFCFLNVMFMNSGIFWSIVFVFSYSLFPLILYYICKFIGQGTLSNREAIILAVVLAASASKVIFFVPMIFGILAFVIFKFSYKDFLRLNFKKLSFILVSFVLLFAYELVPLVFEIVFNIQKDIPGALQDSTALSIQGGFLYQLLNLSSWVLYTPWFPRSVLSFYTYYLSNFYISAFLSVYVVILFFLVKSKDLLKKAVPFLAVLLLSVFFAKGPQPPLGGIFNYLINHISLLSVIRSPDSKFGIGISFSLSAIILLIFLFNKKKKYLNILRLYVVLLVIMVSYPLIAGKVIVGENISGQSGSFATQVFPEYKEVIDVLNQDQERSGVLIYPASNLPNLSHGGQIFIGKDILGAQSNKSFLYISYSALTNVNLMQKLKDIYDGFDFGSIKDTNARYVIIRKDTFKDGYTDDVSGFRKSLEISGIADKLVDNRYLQLYKIKDEYYQPKFYLTDADKGEKIAFSFLSPVKYVVEIDNIRDTKDLVFLESYNKYWKLYPLKFKGDAGGKNFLDDISYLYKKPVFDATHEVALDYANRWKLAVDPVISRYGNDYYETNPDGTKNIKLLAYFIPQSYSYFGAAVSGAVLLSFIGYLVGGSLARKFKKNKTI